MIKMEVINCSCYGWMYFVMLLSILSVGVRVNINKVYSFCMDVMVYKNDGFMFGFVFVSNKFFFYNKI